ncbi:hypothetical protein NLA05_18005 [Xanthomonas citri pv. anacardii]|uniref:ATP-grasp fold amidoligase family protein n=1 Tax=Xanthomonas citri TaxID=346 RepID=UPI000CCC886A|nr:ATP-grasp fold amidoligase family protein [Xanthomonas citri]MCT8358129.1 hypothetical protein [Xanthomonas citri pv. anacardii]MCT8362187.1 hypothetical protein [Xanthomonas citri pv. anacardii]MCT8366238.1 hypothetical protein [Xanthomonas citri pv. anacardii]MCT8370262.1 hypothetical protein [Xanthomonas citri pv. anacardii]MCT8374226.1 hypothetical protein [Xanthomonas citri pv. anacardii]
MGLQTQPMGAHGAAGQPWAALLPALAVGTARPAALPRTAADAANLKRLLRKGARSLVRTLPWRHQDRLYFLHTFGRLPDLYAPKCFNEKILYRKCVHGDYLQYQRLADKFAVRPYVAVKIGEAHLIPLLLDTTDPQDLLRLPQWQQTVIKANHGAAMVEVVREIHYRDIPPRILVEKYIGDAQQVPVDYKFHMFRQADGTFKYVLQVIYGRFDTPKLSMTFFVGNLHDAFHRIRDDGRAPPCAPELLEQALELSKVLASDFDYVRVDWYIQHGQVYFGELTFTPGAGLVTGLDRGLDRMMGDMWVQRRAPEEPCLPMQGFGVGVRVPQR